MDQDPTRRSEYAAHVRYALARASQIRTALAAKERRTSQFYARQGDTRAASLYARAAGAWEDGTRRLGPRSAGATVRTAPTPARSRRRPGPIPSGPGISQPPQIAPPVMPTPQGTPIPPPTPPGSSWPVMPLPQVPPPPPPPTGPINAPAP